MKKGFLLTHHWHWAVAGSLLVMASTWYDGWLSNRAVPYLLQYIPPSATTYLITGPLGSLWQRSTAHPVLDAFAADFPIPSTLRSHLTIATNRIASQCLSLTTVADLAQNGFDPLRGMSVAVIDSKRQDYLIALPITDRPRAEAFFRMYIAPPTTLVLAAEDAAQPVKAIHVKSVSLAGLKACRDSPIHSSLAAGAYSLGDSDAGELRYNIVPDGAAPRGTVAVECNVEYVSGEFGVCTCQIEGLGSCTEPLAVNLFERVATPTQLGTSETISTVRLSGSLSAVLVFTQTNFALVALQDRSALAALDANTNLARFRADDSFQQVLRETIAEDTPEDGTVFGAMLAPRFPIAGNVHFALSMKPAQLNASIVVPWQTLETTILTRLLTPLPQQIVTKPPLSNLAALNIKDSRFGSYVKYALDNFERQTKDALETLGPFSAFIEEVARIPEASDFSFAFHGVQAGVPGFLVSVTATKDSAETIIQNLRVKFRTARDKEILTQALHNFEETHPDGDTPGLDDLRALLEQEADPLWHRYKFKSEDEDREEDNGKNEEKDDEKDNPLGIRAVGLIRNDFANPSYDITENGRAYRFLAPPLTDNDIKYRLKRAAKLAEDMFGEPQPVDVPALKSNRYRLAAFYDDRSDRLVISNNLSVLADFAAAAGARSENARADIAALRAKLTLHAIPQRLLNEGLGYPSKDVRNSFRNYHDLDRYNRMMVTIEPRAESSHFIAKMTLGND